MPRRPAALALLLVVVVCCTISFAAAEEFEEPPPPTDNEIKGMKVKELRQWIGDHGLECKDCFEKGDFRRLVNENRNAKLLPSKRPRKVSNEPIDKQWKEVTQGLCNELGADATACKPLVTVVSGAFEQHARRIVKQLGTTQPAIAKTSMGEPYFGAGVKIIKQTLNWMVKHGITSQSKIRPKCDDRIKMYLTAVAADNVNPMYDLIKEKDAKEEL